MPVSMASPSFPSHFSSSALKIMCCPLPSGLLVKRFSSLHNRRNKTKDASILASPTTGQGIHCHSINLQAFLYSVAIITPRALSATSVEDGSSGDTETIPTPKVIIDQDSDLDATVVEITFGDRLGALLDTMNALKNLGLNVVKANVFLDSSGKHNKFAITRADTGRKVDDPELLEAIRLTIINNLLEYHPESSAQLAMGAAFGVTPPTQQIDVDIATHVKVNDDGPERSLLYVETADRPGLLVDLVKAVTDINVAVVSGEFDTEGLLAKAKFHVSYRGKALIKPLQQVLANSLRYFLRRPSTEESSF